MRDGVKVWMVLLGVVGVLGAATPACTQVKTRIPVVAYSDDGEYLEPQYGRGLVRSSDAALPDVPSPIGFKLVRSRSSASFDGAARTLTHIYQGRTRRGDLLNYYRNVLEENGWRPVGPRDAPILSYENDAERLSLSVADDGKRATVTVVVYPLGG